MRHLGLLLVLTTIMTLGCDGSDSDTADVLNTPFCPPNATMECLCVDGSAGLQQCDESGTGFTSPCVCHHITDAGATDVSSLEDTFTTDTQEVNDPGATTGVDAADDPGATTDKPPINDPGATSDDVPINDPGATTDNAPINDKGATTDVDAADDPGTSSDLDTSPPAPSCVDDPSICITENPCQYDVCNPETGACQFAANIGFGTPCPDPEPDNECSVGECQFGQCVGKQLSNTGCNTSSAACPAGICSGGHCFAIAEISCNTSVSIPLEDTGLCEDLDVLGVCGADKVCYSTDENLGKTTCGEGACLHTIASCADGVTQSCDPLEGATVEICADDIDNDCDGETDEDSPDCLGDPACQEITSIGCCEGPNLKWCNAAGELTEVTCDLDQPCGWAPLNLYYDCTAFPVPDPPDFPKECP